MPENDQSEAPQGTASGDPLTVAKPRIRREGKATTVVLSTAETITSAVVIDTEVDALPPSAKLSAPYGFYDDDGKLNSWAAGQVITDHDELALLVERGAIFEAT